MITCYDNGNGQLAAVGYLVDDAGPIATHRGSVSRLTAAGWQPIPSVPADARDAQVDWDEVREAIGGALGRAAIQVGLVTYVTTTAPTSPWDGTWTATTSIATGTLAGRHAACIEDALAVARTAGLRDCTVRDGAVQGALTVTVDDSLTRYDTVVTATSAVTLTVRGETGGDCDLTGVPMPAVVRLPEDEALRLVRHINYCSTPPGYAHISAVDHGVAVVQISEAAVRHLASDGTPRGSILSVVRIRRDRLHAWDHTYQLARA